VPAPQHPYPLQHCPSNSPPVQVQPALGPHEPSMEGGGSVGSCKARPTVDGNRRFNAAVRSTSSSFPPPPWTRTTPETAINIISAYLLWSRGYVERTEFCLQFPKKAQRSLGPRIERRMCKHGISSIPYVCMVPRFLAAVPYVHAGRIRLSISIGLATLSDSIYHTSSLISPFDP